jgi:cell division protein DivIC
MATNQRGVLNPFKPFVSKFRDKGINRYLLVLLIFGIWLIIFDRASLLKQYRLSSALKKLEREQIFYKDKIQEAQQQHLDMINDQEKFAREHYYMKAADEDVYIVEPEKK